MKRATLYLLPNTNEIVLHCRHDILDGIGSFIFFNNLLQILASPREVSFGDEAKNLSPCFAVAAHLPEANLNQIDKMNSIVKKWVSSFPSLGLASTNLDHLPGPCEFQRLQFSVEDTAKVIAAAKDQAFTPTHVVHAALILAAKQHGDHFDDSTYSSFALFNLRGRCEAPFDSNKHPMATYHTGWPLTVSPTSLSGTAQQLKKVYTGFLADEDSIPMLTEYLRVLETVISTPPPAPSTEPVVSSLGLVDTRLDDVYGKIKLKDFWLASEMVTPTVETFI